MAAYYNEFDSKAAAWLRELIKKGHIADGVVDERSISDVKPSDLTGFDQCHFFAGIGGWSLALRFAGVPDSAKVWTGSCPCQPFSSAGKGGGFADERHLWPHWQWLIQQCKPAIIFGEQVASKAVEPWIDLVHADMEAMGYAFGCVPFPSASVGAPHIRDRAYWAGFDALVNTKDIRHFGGGLGDEISAERTALGGRKDEGCGGHDVTNDGGTVRMADAERGEWGSGGICGLRQVDGPKGCGSAAEPARDGDRGGLADTPSIRCGQRSESAEIQEGWQPRPNARRELAAGSEGRPLPGGVGATLRVDRSELLPGPTNGLWRDPDWLYCRDGKWRPVEPGTFPLAHGVPARVGRLRGYGNAINPFQAAEFIRAALIAKEVL